MKNIEIEYFAAFKDLVQKASEKIDTEVQTAAELYEQIQGQYGLTLGLKSVKVAINDEFTSWNEELNDGDKVVFIPPVAGG